MVTVCNVSECTGCKACINVCKKNAIIFQDNIDQLNCFIDPKTCVNCGACRRICPNNQLVNKVQPLLVKQGWAEDRIRSRSTSGGIATCLMESFIHLGGYVCSCVFEKGRFTFKATNNLSDVHLFSGSKYVKSDPVDAFPSIDSILKSGQKVLFIGLPCQVAGVINYFKDDSKLYTIDLICHGTPSEKLLQKHLCENGIDMNSINNIRFREKLYSNDRVMRKYLHPAAVEDGYLSMFSKCIDFTENCYSCKYASLNRVADITLGDAWGQMSDYIKEGVSLVLCQSTKGEELLKQAPIQLFDVDIQKAIEANHQLEMPATKPLSRVIFLNKIKNGKSFRFARLCAEPKAAIKQNLKFLLIKTRVMSDVKREGYMLSVEQNE